jgi:hypothetical protein
MFFSSFSVDRAVKYKCMNTMFFCFQTMYYYFFFSINNHAVKHVNHLFLSKQSSNTDMQDSAFNDCKGVSSNSAKNNPAFKFQSISCIGI